MAYHHHKGQTKIKKVLGEFKRGTLHSGKGGSVVKKKSQAVAIALSEARRAGAKIPKKKASSRRKMSSDTGYARV